MSVDLRHGDNLKVLPTLPACSVDAIVTDPPYGLAFMGRTWDVSVPVDIWAECLRVLRPGGHLLAFGGTRTWHRQAVAIEDAGFEIRDSIAWLYGSGFPKSLDVGAAITKAAGLVPSSDEWPPEAERWRGYGTALKPASEPIVVARKPLTGTVAANVLAYSTGAMNIDATRVAHASAADLAESAGKNQHTRYANPGSNRDSYSGSMPARQDYDGSQGRWPANVVLTHPEQCTDVCVDGCPVAELDAQSGTLKSGDLKPYVSASGKRGGIMGETVERDHDYTRSGDAGGASRFFPTFRYQAKAPTSERPKIDGQGWPTVKPLALMRWLVRLVTPPGGLVLDPFAGTGSTLQACELEGFDSLGVELDDFAYQLACQRLDLDVRDVVGHEGSIAQTGAA